MRAGYKTRMRFYRDIPDSTEVVWYRVPVDRPFLPIPTIFADWDWEEDNPWGLRTPGTTVLGEQMESYRTYPASPLPRRSVFRGVYCGTPQQWAFGDGLPVVPPVLLPDGFPPCCGPSSIPFPDIATCRDLANLAQTLFLQYTNNAAAQAFFQAQYGPGFNWVFGQENGPGVIPGFTIGVSIDWAVVIISGTTNFQQYATQGLGQIGPSPFFTPNDNGYRTSNVYQNSANFVLATILANVPAGLPVLVIGHSYGGALAMIVGLNLKDAPNSRQVTVATFGSPKTGDLFFSNLASTLLDAVISVVNDGDPVPRIPPRVPPWLQSLFPGLPYNAWSVWQDNPYRQGLMVNGVLYPNPGSFLDAVTSIYIFGQLALNNPLGPFEPHSPAEYARRLLLINCGGAAPPPGRNVLFLDAISFNGFPQQRVQPWPDLSGQGNNAVQITFGQNPFVSLPVITAPAQYVTFTNINQLKIPTLSFSGPFSLAIVAQGPIAVSGFSNRSQPAFSGVMNPGFTELDYGCGGTQVQFPFQFTGDLAGGNHAWVILRSDTGAYAFFFDGILLYPPYMAGLGDITVPFPVPTLSAGSDWVSDNSHGSPFSLVNMWDKYFEPNDPQFPYVSNVQIMPYPPLPPPPEPDVITGTIIDYAGAAVPSGYLPCDGTAYTSASQPALYSAIGNTWDTFRGQAAPGAGMFRVPLLNGLVTIAAGPAVVSYPSTSARALADALGEEGHTLVVSEISGHTHVVDDPTHYHYPKDMDGDGFVVQSSDGFIGYLSPAGTLPVSGNSQTQNSPTGISLEPAGGDQPHNTIQPSAAIQKLIKN